MANSGFFVRSDKIYIIKMLQRRDNTGAVCDSSMGMLFLFDELVNNVVKEVNVKEALKS